MFRTVVVLFIAILAPAVTASDYKYAFGLAGEMAMLSGGDSFRYPIQEGFGARFVYRFDDRWALGFDLAAYRLYNDSTISSSLSLSGTKAHATELWKATKIGVTVNRRLFTLAGRADFSVGIGGGLLIWKYVDPDSDTTLKVRGALNETVDYAASELLAVAVGQCELFLTRPLSLTLTLHADHLTTAGAEFRAGINSSRPRWLLGSAIALTFSFGQTDVSGKWRSEAAWSSKTSRTSSSSFDVSNHNGNSRDSTVLNMAALNRAAVDHGDRTLDSDGDGVPDADDDCPHTDRRAHGRVDVFGCPLDSDFDGIPDYLDACPYSQVGALIDTSGCAIDSDVDGVPDGLDDCPNTLYGLTVDPFGCVDLSLLAQPLVLHIDYVSGSYEVDPSNREKLKELARILNFVPEIKLDIYGYTDNIGQERANKLLSEKRARRVRDHLVALGVTADRIKVFGRGESSFIASNDTADGRAKNRRVEMVFYR